ncbi:MAG: LysR family transcriptional regulator [Zoogloeaceae bacterium]|jgi:DNA-binding transcriptional LysR family regulator|nr:LysR family transcriptional regulator [Zoogloeaceae bacterium]
MQSVLTTARLGSFTRAAEALHLSQPAVSAQIQQLEGSLGIRLFDRNKRRVALTAAGQALLPYLNRVFMDVELMLDVSRNLSNLRRGKVMVATLPSIAAEQLPLAIRRFHEEFPDIAIRVDDVVAERIFLLVREEAVDFGIAPLQEDRPDLDSLTLTEDALCVFFPENHPLAAVAQPTLNDISAYPVIATAKGTSVRAVLDHAFGLARLPLDIICEANYMSTALGLVRAGMGLTILPSSAQSAGPCHGLRHTPIHAEGMSRRIALIKKRSRSLSPAAECFLKTLKISFSLPEHEDFSAWQSVSSDLPAAMISLPPTPEISL